MPLSLYDRLKDEYKDKLNQIINDYPCNGNFIYDSLNELKYFTDMKFKLIDCIIQYFEVDFIEISTMFKLIYFELN